MKADVSVIILTDGKVNISTLKNSLGFCNEILVVTNKTIENFAKVRNQALLKANSNWVLFVDDDEEISKELSLEIQMIISTVRNAYQAFYITRKNYFLGEYVGSDKIIRLARKGSGKWERQVHEVWNIEGNIGHLKNKLIHSTATSVSDMIDKINFYSTLHSQANLKEGKKSTILKVVLYPLFKFLQSLLMGRRFVFSLLQSFHSFLSWSKQWKLQKDLI